MDNISTRKIYFTLENKNRDWSGFPHRRTPDNEYVMVYRLLISKTTTGIINRRISDEFANQINLTEKDLFDLASKNTSNLFPQKIDTLENKMREFAKDSLDEFPELHLLDGNSIAQHIYMVSNDIHISGAVSMYYDDKSALRQIAEKENNNLYVIPSSIHEVLVVAANNENSVEELTELVREVNKTSVLPHERLGDEVMFFDRQSNVLSLAKEAQGKKKELVQNDMSKSTVHRNHQMRR